MLTAIASRDIPLQKIQLMLHNSTCTSSGRKLMYFGSHVLPRICLCRLLCLIIQHDVILKNIVIVYREVKIAHIQLHIH